MVNSITGRISTYPAALKTAAAAAVIAALVFAAYSNMFHASFHLDDFHQITDNPHISDITNFTRFFTVKGMGSALDLHGYRPLTTASFALNYALGGPAVEGYHAFNILVHILNAFLVYLITALALSRPGTARPGTLPLVTALIFALHPIQTGAVTYISGRAVLLASFFSLASLYAFMRFRQDQDRPSLAWGAAAPLLLLLGLFSKEMAAGMLGVMLAYDLVFTPSDRMRTASGWTYFALPLSVTGLFVLLWSNMTSNTSTGFGTTEYLMSEAKALLLYLRLLLIPMNQNNDYFLPLTRTPDLMVTLAAVLVGVSLYALFRIRKAMPAEAFFGFWFFITLAPESSFFPIPDIAVEYRLYLPSAGFIALAVLAGSRLLRAPAYRAAAAAAVVVLFGALTFNRNAVWATEYTLWSDTARKSPHSFRAGGYLGNALVSEGRYAEAVPVLERARSMDDGSTDPHTAGKMYENLGWSYFGTGEYEKAAEVFSMMTEKFKGDPKAEYNLAACLMVLGRDAEATYHMEKALEYGLDNFDVRYNLALVYERAGRSGDAGIQAGLALRLAANDPDRFAAAELLTRLTPRVSGRNQ